MPEFTIGNYLATRLEQIGSWKANGESGSWVITGRRAPRRRGHLCFEVTFPAVPDDRCRLCQAWQTG
jgi:hypothetical protein